MTLLVYSSLVNRYQWDDALDVSRKSALDGIAFAPSWRLLGPFIEKQRKKSLVEADWLLYQAEYIEEMRVSYRENSRDWDQLLGRDTVVLLCYCSDHRRCHRTILGKLLLPKCGAVYQGELSLSNLTAQRGVF